MKWLESILPRLGRRPGGTEEGSGSSVPALPHFPARLGQTAKGARLCSYALSLEAFRRGLNVSFFSPRAPLPFDMPRPHANARLAEVFSVSDGHSHVLFRRTRSHHLTIEALSYCKDKYKAKTCWQQAGVPTPRSVLIDASMTNSDIKAALTALTFPLVAKPVRGTQGKYIFMDLESIEATVAGVRQVLSKVKGQAVLLEEQVKGDEYRLYVVGGKAVAGFRRTAAHVIGDGRSDILQLVEQKNRQRRDNPHLASRPIRLRDAGLAKLEAQGMTPESIPPEGVQVPLSDAMNISQGGETQACLEHLPSQVKDAAVLAVSSIPGLDHGGVDLLVADPDGRAPMVSVLEVNAMAQIGGHLFPARGRPADVPAALMDHYFRGSERLHEGYFDMREVVRDLKNARDGMLSLKPVRRSKALARFSINQLAQM